MKPACEYWTYPSVRSPYPSVKTLAGERFLEDLLAELERLDALNLRFVDMLHEHTEKLDALETRIAKLEEAGEKP
jgi:chromosome segregation ATPase